MDAHSDDRFSHWKTSESTCRVTGDSTERSNVVLFMQILDISASEAKCSPPTWMNFAGSHPDVGGWLQSTEH